MPTRDAHGNSHGADGKYTSSTSDEQNDVLGGFHDYVDDLPARVEQIPPDDVVMSAGPESLEDYVVHPSWQVRAASASNPYLTSEQVAFLADPDTQPVPVRSAVALSGHPEATARTCNDPSPTVRALSDLSWDVTPAMRERLMEDPATKRLHWLTGEAAA